MCVLVDREIARHRGALADRRINRVNTRREFFNATPAEAREHLTALAGEILEFAENPEAVEYHQSMTDRERTVVDAGRHHAPANETGQALP